jgi:hypothetical protein
MLTRHKKSKKNDNLTSATRLTNYIKKDCIIDYLDLLKNKKRKLTESSSNKSSSNKSSSNNKKRKSSFDYIVENGYIFEDNIFEKIEKKMKLNNELNNLIKIKEKDINKNFIDTTNILINKKHDIILGSILINYENNTYGYPDMIVSGYWIRKYIKDYPINICENRSKYYIIDIKSSTINLISGGEIMSSKILYDAYKTQIYVYTEALNKLLKDHGINNNVNCGFILGKKYQYKFNGNFISKDPFDRLAIINYNYEKENGIDYQNLTKNALLWQNDLKDNWESFTLNPINKDELYPNMKNTYDKNYKSIKKKIAYENKELTLLWNCGIKNRELAWSNDIRRYDDPKLNCTVLGLEGTAKNNILSKMISILHTDNNYIIDLKNNIMNWQNTTKFEFFIDFETYYKNDFYDNNDYNTQFIYMIGIGYFKNNKFIQKTFIINYDKSNNLKNYINNKKNLNCKYKDYILCHDEEDLIIKTVDYIHSFKPNNMNLIQYYNDCRLIHWSGAEPILFNKKIKEYTLIDLKYKLNWFDLLKIFKDKEYPIIIKECFGYGLKEVVNKLNKYNYIKLNWPDLDDGLLSCFIAKDIYDNKSPTINNKNMVNLTEYNYVDCFALFEILNWLRSII